MERPFFCFCQFIGLVSMSAISQNYKISAAVGQNATLRCSYPEPLQSTQLMRVYWQRDSDTTLLMFNHGILDHRHQNETYRGRVWPSYEELYRGNFDLVLSSLQLNDSGIYKTVFLNSGKAVLICDNYLEVGASYSIPTMTASSQTCVSTNQLVELTCKSDGGFPKPEVRWYIDNHLVDISGKEDLQDNGTMSITGRACLNITGDQNVTCSIFNPMLGEAVYASHFIKKCDTVNITAVVIAIIVLVSICVTAVVICRLRRLDSFCLSPAPKYTYNGSGSADQSSEEQRIALNNTAIV